MGSLIEPKIAHIILAAGASSRMGTPKQLLPWKNTTLISHEIEKSKKLTTADTFVILGANFEIIAKEVRKFTVNTLHNTAWKSGMGSSISFGMQYILKNKLGFHAVLITLIDQPLIDVTHLNTLLATFKENSEAIIATEMDNGAGVPAVFSHHYFEALSKLQDDFGARYIIKNHKEQLITVSGKGKTDDIDTTRQYKDLLSK